MAKRPRGERAGLSRERVLDAALALADRDGLAALSMRRLGAELGVEAMTVYHYFPSKDALLDGLVERVFEPVAASFADGAAWDRALRDYASQLRARLLRHPAVLPMALRRPVATPGALRAVEQVLGVLCRAGFRLGRALDALNALSVFVLGHAAAEVGTADVNRRGGPGSTASLAGDADYPLLSTAAREGQGTDDEERFRFGVDALITGVGLSAGASGRSGRRGRR